MFGVAETPYDLRFRALGIPVRVHPLFWLMGLLMARNASGLPEMVIWVACVFVSIVVHEYGHGLTAKHFGSTPSIVLWMGGGLCYSEADRQTPAQRLAVVLWGPGAGFVLCGVVMVLYSAVFGLTPREHLSIVCELLRFLGLPRDPSGVTSTLIKLGATERELGTNFTIYWDMVQINIIWGLVNLLPVWPLDGGRVSETVLTTINPRDGRRWAHTISLLVGGLTAFAMFAATQQLFGAMFFGYFAFVNYQILQNMHRAHSYGLSDDDWWRR
jgi:stage IV sporulation protein FB